MTPHKATSVVFIGKDNELTKDDHQVFMLFHKRAISVVFNGALKVLRYVCKFKKHSLMSCQERRNSFPFHRVLIRMAR